MQGENNEQMASSSDSGDSRNVGTVGVHRGRAVDVSRASAGSSRYRSGSVVRTLAVSFVVLLIAGACSNDHYSTDTAPGNVPPTVQGIQWVGPQNDYDTDCALGLTQDGLTFVAGAGTPWGLGGIAAEWLSYKITGSATPVGADLGTCWDALTNNSGQFAVMLRCWGEPSIKYWFDTLQNAQAWIAIPYCKCNATCQGMINPSWTAAWKAEERHNRFYRYCSTPPITWTDVQCFAQPPNGWPLGKHGVSGGLDDGPLYGPDGSPLPTTWDHPFWDTTAPVPPHEVNCAKPDCSDILTN